MSAGASGAAATGSAAAGGGSRVRVITAAMAITVRGRFTAIATAGEVIGRIIGRITGGGKRAARVFPFIGAG